MNNTPSKIITTLLEMYPSLKISDIMNEKSGGLNKSEYPVPCPANTSALERKSKLSDTGPRFNLDQNSQYVIKLTTDVNKTSQIN